MLVPHLEAHKELNYRRQTQKLTPELYRAILELTFTNDEEVEQLVSNLEVEILKAENRNDPSNSQ